MFNKNEKMKKGIILNMLFLSGVLFFVSCKKDKEIPKPEIIHFELGHNNSKTAHIGSNLHIDAEIIAPGRIDRIKVEIHLEEAYEHSGMASVTSGEVWEFDSVYTEFTGLKNTIFHKDIPIPEHAVEGEYHFHFSVTDMEGNQVYIDEDIEIIHGEGSGH
jgi:hypothetical protein